MIISIQVARKVELVNQSPLMKQIERPMSDRLSLQLYSLEWELFKTVPENLVTARITKKPKAKSASPWAFSLSYCAISDSNDRSFSNVTIATVTSAISPLLSNLPPHAMVPVEFL